MLIATVIIVLFSLVTIGLSLWILATGNLLWWLPTILIVASIVIGCILFSWLFLPLAVLLFAMVAWFNNAGLAGRIISGILALVIVVGAIFLIAPAKAKTAHIATPIVAASCTSAKNLDIRNSGMVEKDLSDGDSVMGTIISVTKDDTTTAPVLLVVMPGSSVDIAYDGNMYFTDDRFSGSLAEAVCLAESLHPNVTNKIVVGATDLPTGWETYAKVDGWWTASTWLYQADAIQPEGLTCSKDIFVSAVQKSRTLTTKSDEVIYGQFWIKKGSVTHFQIRPNESLPIPAGYQGTYWIWSGDLAKGEVSLQKRMLQATFQEVVLRDKIQSSQNVTLLSCGALPNVDSSLLSFKMADGTVTWQTSLTGWTCKVSK